MTGTQRDPEITARIQKRQVTQEAETASGLTIAERLTRRAKAQTVTVTLLPDEDGEIPVDMQIPSWGLTCELTQMESMMATRKGHLRIAEIMSALCQTPGLDIEFWKSGAIGLTDMRHLIEGLTSESLKLTQRAQEARSFRND